MQQDERAAQVTQLLNRLKAGDAAAGEHLFPLLHEELRGLAQGFMRGERAGHTLTPTALVHEAWLRLGDPGAGEDVQARGQFFGQAAKAMRHVLVDHARARKALKRGGDRERIALDQADPSMDAKADTYIAVDEALTALSETDAQAAQLAELQLFGGLEQSQIAEVMNISLRSVERGWRFAKAFLQRELGHDFGLDG